MVTMHGETNKELAACVLLLIFISALLSVAVLGFLNTGDGGPTSIIIRGSAILLCILMFIGIPVPGIWYAIKHWN